MKRLSKKLIISISAVALVIITAVVLLLTGVLFGRKVGSLSEERYETVGIDFVQMTQVGIHTYNFNITLEEKFANAKDIKLYFSKNDTFDEEKSDILNYTKMEDGTYEIDGVTYNSGDYFLYVIADGKTGTMPLTVPKMAPKTWMNGDVVNIEFEVDGATSWSSFIDPEGKNVYRSASKVFDETAKPMEENIDILTSSFNDPTATLEEPYYYIVFNGKNGKFKYISAPLFYTATQGEASVEFYEKDGKPYLDIIGTLYAVSEDAERVMQLRVGNFNGDDPTSTFMVDNSYKGGDKTAFKFEVPLEDLKASSNNLAIFLTENGTMCEWSINVENLDLEQYSLSSGNARYGLTDNVALKITRMVDAYADINASMSVKEGAAILTVSGTHRYGVGGEDYQLVLTATDGQQYVAENTVNEGKKFVFEFPLDQLYSAGIWYDIQVKCKEEIAYYDIATSAADLSQSVQVGEKKFGFQEYGGLLKVEYVVVKDFSQLTANLTTIEGKPTLSVSGSIKDTTADNLALAIRTGDKVIEAENTATEDGKFSASIDLSQMDKKDTWYDVLIKYKQENQYYDMSTSNANMNQELKTSSHLYKFEEWEGQLKIQYKDLPVTVNNQKAEIVTEGNKAYLVVTGTTLEDAAGYKLALRNGETIVTTAINKAKGKNISYKVDLANLPKSDTWYDIIIGHTGFGDSTDLLISAANMDTSVTVGKKIYKFADYEGQLKVYYNNVLTDIKGVTAKIVELGNKPYLIVEGKMENASQKFLGIRTGDKILKTSNTGKGNNLYFKFNLEKLTSMDTWYDVVIGTNGSDQYRDLTAAAADMGQRVTIGKKVYSFQEYDKALKVTYSKVAEDLKNVKAEITKKNGKPYLLVTGTMNNASSMYLGIRTGEEILSVDNKGTGNTLSFSFDLTKLTSSGTWYDVIIGNKTFTTYKDITKASADLTQKVTYKKRDYKFAEYNSLLKVYFEGSTGSGLAKGQSIEKVSATLILKDGKPILRVQGTSKGIANSNLQLGIRTGETVKVIGNSTSTSNRFLFDYDLTKLAKSGTWYDVVIIEKESGSYMDVSVKAVYNMDMNITYKDNVYRLADYEGDLKVYYTNTAEEEAAQAQIAKNFTDVNAIVTSESNKPVMKITAKIGQLKNKDVTINVRSGDKVITVKNNSSKTGEFEATVDLTNLESKGTWYDVYWKVESEAMEINLSNSQADMSSTYKYNGYTYQFKEWNSMLKVEFE